MITGITVEMCVFLLMVRWIGQLQVLELVPGQPCTMLKVIFRWVRRLPSKASLVPQ